MIRMSIDTVTFGQIATALGLLVAFGGSVVGFIAGLKKILKSLFKEQLNKIDERFSKIEKRLDSVDIETCKNFLVTIIAEVDRGEELDKVQRQRFYEQYEHYRERGGNSYIEARVSELKTAGKL